MKIAILGAPGCVGRNLIKKLLESPEYEIIASYRKKQDAESLKHDCLLLRQVDLFDITSAGRNDKGTFPIFSSNFRTSRDNHNIIFLREAKG